MPEAILHTSGKQSEADGKGYIDCNRHGQGHIHGSPLVWEAMR